MDTLVRIVNVSKVYPRVHKPRERLQAFISLLFGKEPAHGAKVLSGINLDVARGQSLGIVGTNGTPVYGVISDGENITPVKLADHNYRFRIRFTNLNLLPGSYTLTGHSMDPEGLRMFDRSKIAFTITGETKEVGFIRLSHEWS